MRKHRPETGWRQTPIRKHLPENAGAAPAIPRIPTAAEKVATIQASRHKTRDNETKETHMPDPLVPLSHLALEVGATAAELATRLADEVLTDDLGRLAIDRDTARALITEHHCAQARQAAAQRERDQAHRATIAANIEPTRRRVKALQAYQAALRASGQWDDGMSAYETMCVGEHSARLDNAGDRFDAMIVGERRGEYGSGYRIHPQKEQ